MYFRLRVLPLRKIDKKDVRDEGNISYLDAEKAIIFGKGNLPKCFLAVLYISNSTSVSGFWWMHALKKLKDWPLHNLFLN